VKRLAWAKEEMIGPTGPLSRLLARYLEGIFLCKHSRAELRKPFILGTAQILRKMLT